MRATRRRTVSGAKSGSFRRYEGVVQLNNRNDAKTLQIELTGACKEVLEIGPSTGSVARVLRETGCRVTAVEIDRRMATAARKFCDRIILGDVETLPLQKILGLRRFNVVLFGDVLEHLKNPRLVLKKVRPLLRRDGYVVASIPNIAHGSARLHLLKGRFQYGETGLLDSTHLRFYTFDAIEELFADSGYAIAEVRATTKDPFASELPVDPDSIPEEALRQVLADPTSYVYQFVIRAVPTGGRRPPDVQKKPPTALRATRAATQSPNDILLGLYETRPDLQQAFPEVRSGDQRGLQRWAGDVVSRKRHDSSHQILKVYAKWLDSLRETENLREETENLKRERSAALTRLAQIESSVGWTIVLGSRKALNKYLPFGSRRRRLFETPFRRLGRIALRLGPFKSPPTVEAKPADSPVALGYPSEYTAWRRRIDKMLSIGRASAGSRQQPVDIVVPVFNSCTETRRCIESILAKTSQPYQVILVDDGSTDLVLVTYLDELAKLPNVKVLRNKENVGFVKAANIGLCFSKNDVVLLNSDTIVSENWLDGMWSCAYSHARIAVVSPLSNNATICSIPEFCKDNPIPEGFDVESFARLVRQMSDKMYPAIPTAVGFCMYIKRSVLNELGVLDESFSPGYEEENDFCMRAQEAGYAIVLDDSTFVYHKGAASFSERSVGIRRKHFELMAKKHPAYAGIVQGFISDNPLRLIQEKVKEALTEHYRSTSMKILYVIHGPLHHPAAGGTEITCRYLAENLQGFVRYVLYPQDGTLCLDEYSPLGRQTIRTYANMCRNIYSLRNDEIEARFRNILDDLRIDLVHIQHLLFFPLSLVGLAREKGTTVLMSCHDGYYICIQHRLLENGTRYCYACTDLAQCDECLQTQFARPKGFQKTWREASERTLKAAEAIVMASDATLEIYKKVFGETIERTVRVIEHGIPMPGIRSARKRETLPGPVFRVAFIGAVSNPVKGRDVIIDLMRRNVKSNVEWHFFGVKSSVAERLSGKIGEPSQGIINHGIYEEGGLPEVLQREGIHLAILPYLGFEGYSLVLSEVWAAGIPAVVPNLSALGERMRKHRGGWIYEPGASSDELLKLLYQIANDREEYLKAVDRTRRIKVVDLPTYVQQYKMLYESLLANKAKAALLTSPIRSADISLSRYGLGSGMDN